MRYVCTLRGLCSVLRSVRSQDMPKIYACDEKDSKRGSATAGKWVL